MKGMKTRTADHPHAMNEQRVRILRQQIAEMFVFPHLDIEVVDAEHKRIPPIATMVSQGMLGAPMLAEIQDAPSNPTVPVSRVSPFAITVIRQITEFSGKYTSSID